MHPALKGCVANLLKMLTYWRVRSAFSSVRRLALERNLLFLKQLYIICNETKTMNDSHFRLTEILEKAHQEEILAREEIVFLLGLREKSRIEAVFAAARELRSRHFGNRVFLYGFIYISTFCRNHCNFCYYRSVNAHPVRYRRKASDIIAAAQGLAESGVHLIDLTLGEDPLYFQDQGFKPLFQLIKAVRQTTGLPVMISPGVVSADVLSGLSEAGASWYACYQETHNRELFKRLRPGQSYAARMENKELAGQLGLLTEEGLLCGVGETSQDIADSIRAMRLLKVSQMRAMTFVPQKGTPMQSWKNPDPLREMLVIAVLRLAFPGGLIPATLDVAGLAGLHSRLEALSVYFTETPQNTGSTTLKNKDLELTKAFHAVLGYNQGLFENARLKTEFYYQFLFNVPVENDSISYYSTLNYSGGLITYDLDNKGTGFNYGIEITIEKFYSRNYYFLLTGSVFDSKFKASNGVIYNTLYNGSYVINLVGGKDFKTGVIKTSIIGINTKFLLMGGNRMIPIDLEKSINAGYTVYNNNEIYKSKLPDFFRLDFGISFQKNKPKYSWKISFDIQNVTNRDNTFALYYDNDTKSIRKVLGLKFIPILNYRLEF